MKSTRDRHSRNPSTPATDSVLSSMAPLPSMRSETGTKTTPSAARTHQTRIARYLTSATFPLTTTSPAPAGLFPCDGH